MNLVGVSVCSHNKTGTCVFLDSRRNSGASHFWLGDLIALSLNISLAHPKRKASLPNWVGASGDLDGLLHSLQTAYALLWHSGLHYYLYFRKNAAKAMETCVRPEGFHQKGEEAGLVVESEQNVHKEDAQVLPFTNNKVHSESESIDDLSFNSGESEDDWDAPYNMGQEQASSDNLSSDEESLIEIALQSGNCVDYLSNQRRLKELLLEMNEEDNMIEIDIAVGSIKCSPS